MSTLPHPSELTATQAILEVNAYDEFNDAFECTMHTAAPCDGTPCVIPALLLPMLVHEYGPPTMFILRSFLVEPGAKKADYRRVHGMLHIVAEEMECCHVNQKPYVLQADYVNTVYNVMNDSPYPDQL